MLARAFQAQELLLSVVSIASFDPAAVRPAGAAAIAVEIVDAARFASQRGAWSELLTRTDEPNVFMDPAVVLAANAADKVHVLLAWQAGLLVGVWAFSEGWPQHSPLPVRVLSSPPHAHAHLATPVIDRAHLAPVLSAMLDAIVADASLPKILTLAAIGTGGATMEALTGVLAERASPPCLLAQALRPRLDCGGPGTRDVDTCLDQMWSGSTRKKLRQHRRRLGEQGALTRVIHREPQAVHDAFEDFVALEASGWKGREGTALINDASDAAFMRAAVAGLAEHGNITIDTLVLNGKPVSMQLIARSGAAAFTWKTTYDENYRDYSPGTLLLQDYTASFLADSTVAFVDSCAYDETSFMSAWAGRQAVADLWLDARRGGSPAFRMLAGLQTAYRAARAAAKRAYHAARNRRKTRSRPGMA